VWSMNLTILLDFVACVVIAVFVLNNNNFNHLCSDGGLNVFYAVRTREALNYVSDRIIT
jgi:hypothetical protein